MSDDLQKLSKYLEYQTEPQLEPTPIRRDILREIFQRGPLSPIEISVAIYSNLIDVEEEINYLQEKQLLKKFREIDGQQFYTLSYKGRKRLTNPKF